jgi:LPS export ABC transporter protein LptC
MRVTGASPGRMKGRTTIIYVASGFVVASLMFAGYFFFKKPEKIAPPSLAEGKAAIVFKDVKYSGEKKGVIDWEVRGKTGKKYIDKPVVEMEQMEGEYKPKPGMIVRFKGSKGSMDTEQETGTVENVTITHNDNYTLTTKYLDFDFQKGLTTTSAPVTIEGSRLTLMGVGLVANTKDETIKIIKNVTGFVETKKGKYKFAADTFVYYMKDNRYLLDGNAMMSGEDMKVTCARLYIYTDGEEIEKIDARGKVRMASKGSVAKNEQAVYHFKDNNIPSTEPSKTEKNRGGAAGKANPIKPAGGRSFIEQSSTRQEKR